MESYLPTAAILFGANWGDWIFPIVGVVVWVLVNMSKKGAEEPPRRVPPRRPDVPPRRPDMNAPGGRGAGQQNPELDKLLRELGMRPEEVQTARPTPRPAQRPPNRDQPPRRPQPAVARREPPRRPNAPSEVKRAAPAPAKTGMVLNQPLSASAQLQPPPTPVAVPLKGRRTKSNDLIFQAMLTSPGQISRAIILGEILGKPLCLRDDPPRL
ncbi:MAG: hypothetical protein ACRDD1_14305 [Planctomycetia bacterium]